VIVDTSALLAIVVGEPARDACLDAIEKADDLRMSAATLAECLIVSIGKGVAGEMRALLDVLDAEVMPVTTETAYAASDACLQWGKGRHPAGLNYGDCFSYVAAKQTGLPLLFVGDDFSRTDVTSVL
jgi:ribonuclease VapC